MVTKAETDAVYSAALVQGIALVTFPAASSIFTDPNQYDLSTTQYGAMFLPQVVVAIVASLLGAGLTRRERSGCSSQGCSQISSRCSCWSRASSSPTSEPWPM